MSTKALKSIQVSDSEMQPIITLSGDWLLEVLLRRDSRANWSIDIFGNGPKSFMKTGLTDTEAKSIYDSIKDYVSVAELLEFGFTHA